MHGAGNPFIGAIASRNPQNLSAVVPHGGTKADREQPTHIPPYVHTPIFPDLHTPIPPFDGPVKAVLQ